MVDTTTMESPVPDGAGGLPGLDFSDLLPARSAEDILSGTIRVTLGTGTNRREYALQVLSIAGNRRWKAGLEGYLLGLLGAVERAGDDLASVLAAFTTSTDDFLTVLYAYDRAHNERGEPTREGVLPPRERLEEEATDAQVLLATLGVWSAANPFAAIALSVMRAADNVPPVVLPTAPPMNGSSTPTSSVPRSTAGPRRRSRRS